MSKYSNVTIEQIPKEKFEDAMKVRIAVFVHEQKYTLESEYDGLDEDALHFVAYADKQKEDTTVEPQVPVGTLRLLKKPNNVAKLGRLAVLSEARGLYIGQKLVKTYIDFVKQNGYTSIVLHSQYPRRGFYEKLGFVIEEGEEIFDEDGTPHIRMWMRKL